MIVKREALIAEIKRRRDATSAKDRREGYDTLLLQLEHQDVQNTDLLNLAAACAYGWTFWQNEYYESQGMRMNV